MKRLLITAHGDDAARLLEHPDGCGHEILHLPLERYQFRIRQDQVTDLLGNMEPYRFVLHGEARNTRAFLRWVRESDLSGRFRELIHLVTDQRQAEWLESAGIPAIAPAPDARAIDLMEFLLRLSVDGRVICPVTEGQAEELPGLLEEMGIGRFDLTVNTTVPMPKEELENVRSRLNKTPPQRVLFHSRSSVVRIPTAFPELNLSRCHLIAASKGVADTLRRNGQKPVWVAGGTWASVREELIRQSASEVSK